MRSVRLMTLQTALTCKIVYRIVFKEKRPCHIRMAADTVHFGRSETLMLVTIGMYLVAVAADQASFRNRMMEVIAELSGLFAMAAPAERGFVRSEQRLRVRRGAVYRVPDGIIPLDALRRRQRFVVSLDRFVTFAAERPRPVQLVACCTGDACARVACALPMLLGHRIVVTPHADRGTLVRFNMPETNDVIVGMRVRFEMGRVLTRRAVARLAAAPVQRFLRVTLKERVR